MDGEYKLNGNLQASGFSMATQEGSGLHTSITEEIKMLRSSISELEIEIAMKEAAVVRATDLYAFSQLSRQRQQDEIEDLEELRDIVRRLQTVFDDGWEEYLTP